MTLKKSEDAISPVIGVMLMLAVTVIIAAAVVMISTGLMADTEPAPTANLDIKLESARYKNGYSDYYVPDLQITHVSGDPLNTADLRLTFTWDCPHGSSCSYTDDGHHFSSYAYEDKPEGYANGLGESEGGLFGISRVFVPSGYVGTLQPLYINSGSMAGKYFGSFTMTRGMTLCAFSVHLVEDHNGEIIYHHKGNPALDVILNNGHVMTECFEGDESDLGALGYTPCPEDGCDGYLYYEDGYTYCDGCSSETEGDTTNPATLKGQRCEYDGCSGAYNIYLDDGEYECYYCYDSKYIGLEPSEYLGLQQNGELTPGIMECLPVGTPVDVMVIHIPSNKPIYSKTVYVQ